MTTKTKKIVYDGNIELTANIITINATEALRLRIKGIVGGGGCPLTATGLETGDMYFHFLTQQDEEIKLLKSKIGILEKQIEEIEKIFSGFDFGDDVKNELNNDKKL